MIRIELVNAKHPRERERMVTPTAFKGSGHIRSIGGHAHMHVRVCMYVCIQRTFRRTEERERKIACVPVI